MERYNKIQFCNVCNQNNVIQDWYWNKDKTKKIPTIYPINIRGYFVNVSGSKKESCSFCGNNVLTETSLTIDDFKKICAISTDPDFFVAMAELKEKDSIEFYAKLGQMSGGVEQKSRVEENNTPKCPTCGSPNIKKISGTKRWLGTGLFGLASSDIGKTMCCNSCGYKW